MGTFRGEIDRTPVCPAKAGNLSRRLTGSGNNQNPVTWMAASRVIERLKPIDKAVFSAVSECSGRNVSEHIGSLVMTISEAEPFGVW